MPFAAIPRWSEALAKRLASVLSAHRSGNADHVQERIKDLTCPPSAGLADVKGSKGHAGRTIGRLDRLEETDHLGDDADDCPSAPPPPLPVTIAAVYCVNSDL